MALVVILPVLVQTVIHATLLVPVKLPVAVNLLVLIRSPGQVKLRAGAEVRVGVTQMVQANRQIPVMTLPATTTAELLYTIGRRKSRLMTTCRPAPISLCIQP